MAELKRFVEKVRMGLPAPLNGLPALLNVLPALLNV